MSNGRFANSLKSSGVNVRPIVSMIIPRITVCVLPFTHSKSTGKKNVTTAVRMTKRLAFPLSTSLIVLNIRYISFYAFNLCTKIVKNWERGKRKEDLFAIQRLFSLKKK